MRHHLGPVGGLLLRLQDVLGQGLLAQFHHDANPGIRLNVCTTFGQLHAFVTALAYTIAY